MNVYLNEAPSGVFYLAADCPTCDAVLLSSLCATALEQEGVPVIPIGMSDNMTFRCDCGTNVYTGQNEPFTEQ